MKTFKTRKLAITDLLRSGRSCRVKTFLRHADGSHHSQPGFQVVCRDLAAVVLVEGLIQVLDMKLVLSDRNFVVPDTSNPSKQRRKNE